ncbi:DUF3866 family protein [Salinithrix halophila]|uniref:DUF3866 family protein n=1 Tax=Salinithrix halophila TaxID=1485204 RepID=A0ABV8JLF5_9BACL
MIEWTEGTVVTILEDGETIQRLLVEEEGTGCRRRAIHYPPLLGKAKVGDAVWLNVTAVRLGLGTGGVHFTAGWLFRPPYSPTPSGHIMKLRYTPLQMAVLTGEEERSPYHERMREACSLEGTPVLLGELHSMLPTAAATWRFLGEKGHEQPRVVYVMTDGGALPIAFSRHVQNLEKNGFLDGTVTAGNAFGGGLEAVNLYSALLLARHVLRADLIFVSMGPGIVGTGTLYGFSGIEQGQAVNAVHSLGGIPVFIPRLQETDSRGRHRGVSHHTETNLGSVALAPAVVPYPSEPESLKVTVEEMARTCFVEHRWLPVSISTGETKNRLRLLPEPVKTMGRCLEEDPLFFRTICGAAEAAYRLWRFMGEGSSSDDATTRLMSGDA